MDRVLDVAAMCLLLQQKDRRGLPAQQVLRLHLQAFRLRLADLNRPAAAPIFRPSDQENH